MVLSEIKSRVEQMTAGAKLSLVAVGTLATATVLALASRPMLALLFVLVVVFVVGLLWFVGWAIKVRARRREQCFDKGMAGDALDEFKSHWKQAVDEFRSTGVDRYNFGFYMLIGEPASGKSTTLRKSGLNFPIGMEAISGAGGTRNCDWWFPDEAIILDTAGRLTFHEDVETDERSWKLFLQLLKTYKPHSPITGVIVVIPCTSLLEDSDEERQRKAEIIRDALTEIERTLEVQFPVYVLVTKADRIGGFSEFFAHLKTMEQFQLFGWSRPRSRFGTRFDPAELGEVFHGMVERLRKLRFRLIHETASGDPHKFARIFPFPEEFEALEKPLAGYLETVFPASKLLEPLLFQGFYITSGLQQGVPVLQACASLFGGSESSDDELQQALEQERVYFIRDFYRKKLFQERGLVFPTGARIKRVKFFERLGYGAALAVGLIGILVLTLHALGLNRQVEAPLGLLDSIGSMRNGIETETGRRSESRIRAALAAAFELAEIDEHDELVGLISAIHRRDTLSNFSILGVGDAERSSMLQNLARVQRSLFVKVLEPFLFDVDAELQETKSTELLEPARFETYRRVFLSFMKLMTQARVDESTPESLEPLFDFARARIGPAWMPLARDADRLYRTLLRVDALAEPALLSGLERTTPDQFKALGIPNAGLASGLERTLKRCLDIHRDRWLAFLQPEKEISLPAASPDETVRTAYLWGRLRILHNRINESLKRLERIQTDRSIRSEEFIYQWEQRTRESFPWLTEYGTIKSSCAEIDRLLGGGDRPLRAWDDCLRELERAELREGFYGKLKQLSRYQGQVESSERELLGGLSSIKTALLEVFPLEGDSWSRRPQRSGFRFAVQPLEKPEQEGQRLFKLSWEFKGLELKELHGTRELLDEFVSLLERGSRKAAEPVWGNVFADRTSVSSAESAKEPLLLNLQFLGGPLELLRAHSKRLQEAVDRQGISDSSRQMRRIASLAIHCLALKYLRQLHEPYLKGQPALLARMIQEGKREDDAGAEGFAARAPSRLVAYLDAICQWTEELSLPAFMQQFPGDRKRILGLTLDDLAASYLDDWYAYWSAGYWSEEREQFAGTAAKPDWTSFAAAVVKTLDGGAIARYGIALEKFSEGIELGELPARSPHLPKTSAAWQQRSTVLARMHGLWNPDFDVELRSGLELIHDLLERPAETARRVTSRADPEGAQKIASALLLCKKRLEALPPSAREIRVPVLSDVDALCSKARELLALEVASRMREKWNRICADPKLDGLPLRSGSKVLSVENANRFFQRGSGILDEFLAEYDAVLGIGRDSSGETPLLEVSPPRHFVTSLEQCVAWRDFLLGEAQSLPESEGLEYEIRLADYIALRRRFTRVDTFKLSDTGIKSAVLRRDIASTRKWKYAKDAVFRLEAELSGEASLGLGKQAESSIQLKGAFAFLAFIDRYLPRDGGAWTKAKGQKKIVLKVPAKNDRVEGSVDLRIEFPSRPFPGELPDPAPWKAER